jgi:hypothetical protein
MRRRRQTPSPRRPRRRTSRPRARSGGSALALEVEQIDALRRELQGAAQRGTPARWNADPEDARRSVAKLVLTLVDFIRQLMERQALRRMDEGTLSADQIERMGVALMRLEETLREMAQAFGLSPDDLNLDLGPIGKLR